MTSTDRVAQAADELYQLDLGDFTARRAELAGAARAQGDRSAAEEIKVMRKPTLAAWVVNLAARADLPEIADLRRTAEQLRAAQAGLDSAALKGLTATRQADERAAVAAVVSVAQQAGVTVRDNVLAEISATLRALVADPAAEQAAVSGRLTKALSYAGFGEVDIAAAVATGGPALAEHPAPHAASDSPSAQSRREAAERLTAATAAAEQAADGVRRATESRDHAEKLRGQAHSELERLRAELNHAERNLTTAEHDLSAAESALSQAVSDNRDAEQRRHAAAAELGTV